MENLAEIAEKIKNGGIGVLPTDTLYGITGTAFKKDVVDKIYEIRDRNRSKPFVTLISSPEDVLLFNPNLDPDFVHLLKKIWPASVSVLIPVPERYNYIAQKTGHIAMRVPNYPELQNLLKETGPVISTSVNKEGEPPALTIDEAKKNFPNLDFYVDAGKLSNPASTLIAIEKGKAKIIRQGEWQVPDFLI